MSAIKQQPSAEVFIEIAKGNLTALKGVMADARAAVISNRTAGESSKSAPAAPPDTSTRDPKS